MKYIRKTPVEAIQWNGHNLNEVSEFISRATKSYSMWNDDFGNLDITYSFQKGRVSQAVVPLFGWVVREGKTFQFYKDSTFRKTFDEVQEDGSKGIDWEGMNKTIKEAFDGFDEVFKDFKDVFGSKPSKKSSGVLSTMVRLNNKGRMAKLIDDLYKGDEKTREEIKKNLSEGLKEMEDADKTKGTETDTFESVLDEMKELHAKKNKDYNESFHNLFKEYGMSYALGHIEEKLNRVKAIIANGGNAVKNEHIEDSLIDGACYNILTLIELRNRKH